MLHCCCIGYQLCTSTSIHRTTRLARVSDSHTTTTSPCHIEPEVPAVYLSLRLPSCHTQAQSPAPAAHLPHPTATLASCYSPRSLPWMTHSAGRQQQPSATPNSCSSRSSCAPAHSWSCLSCTPSASTSSTAREWGCMRGGLLLRARHGSWSRTYGSRMCRPSR